MTSVYSVRTPRPRPTPKPKIQVLARLDPEVKAAITERAIALGWFETRVIEEALRAYLASEINGHCVCGQGQACALCCAK